MRAIMLAMLLMAPAVANAEKIEDCSIGAGRHDGRLEFRWSRSGCSDGHGCDESNSDMDWSKWTGIVPADLQREGAAIDARRNAEAGEMRCVGTVHGGALHGRYSFTSNPEFVRKMGAMGFDGLNQDRLQGYALLDVTTTWVRELKDTHVRGMDSDKLMGMRALNVDAAYTRAMAADGYPELEADKLISMRAVGVSPEKVKEIRAMGYSPNEEELIQMSVFKIDAPFVEKIKKHGFKSPTIAQLVQIKIFNLDE